MKTVKLIHGNLNNNFAELPPTSQDVGGRLRSLKKDGTFIEGRMPLEEENSMLWRYSLTSKQKINKNDTQLFATIYVPESGVDEIDNDNKKKIGLLDFIENHQNVCYFKTVIEGGIAVRKQVNKNYRRNPMFYFELIDETAIEEKKYNDSRLETKYRAVIDELFDKSENNDGEFLEVCYGCGIVKPERNTKRQNYNLLINKLQINPENFKMYWEDADRVMINTIRKAERLNNPLTSNPYITSNETGLAFFNGIAIGKGIDEMKVHFRQHSVEYDYLVRVIRTELPLATDTSTKVEKTPIPQKAAKILPETNGATGYNMQQMRLVNMEIGKLLSSMKKCKDKNDENGVEEVKKRIEDARNKFPKLTDYFNNKLNERSIEKGIAIT